MLKDVSLWAFKCLRENHSLLLLCQNPIVRTVTWPGMQSKEYTVVRAAISN